MQRNTKLGLGLFVVSFFSLGTFAGIAEDLTKKELVASPATLALAPGRPWRAVLPGPYSACRGAHDIVSPSARFLPETGEPVDLTVESIDERPMRAATDVSSIDFDAKLLEEPVEATLLVQIPEMLEGRRGQVVLSGAIILAKIDLDRGQHSFDIDVDPGTFEETFSVSFGSEEAREFDEGKGPHAEEIRRYEVLAGISSFGLMLSVVLMLWTGIGARLLIASCLLIGVPALILNLFFTPKEERLTADKHPDAKNAQQVTPGAPFAVRPDLGISSVDNFHRISYLSAWIKGVGHEQIEVAAKATGNKNWSDPIQVGYVRVGPVFKTNRFPINPSLSVELPTAELLPHETATLVVYGVVNYPDLGVVEILNPLNIKYDLAAKSFTETVELDFRAKNEGDTPNGPVSKSLPEEILAALMLMGALLLSFGIFRGIKRAIFG